MTLSSLDWAFIIGFFIISLAIGIYTSRQAGKSAGDFFLSGRNMPWWLLGVSMVATTFSADTPNLVTDIVRKDGVSGNWVWWAFLLTGMLTVFVYARLWRRSGVMTDVEFYELRYSGKAAAFLRGFRALYLGVFFNIAIMATVCLAGIKIGSVMLGLTPTQTLLIASVVTVIYSTLGGLRGIIITDFFQFILAMIGTFAAAYVIINTPEVGGLSNLLQHENVKDSLNIFPDFNDTNVLVPLLIIPLAVQWWSVYYPGAEPGGGGYIAQRMLSAKDEKNAVGATLLFNFAHYAIRPWPWILIALASMIVFPMKMSNVGTPEGIRVTQDAKDFLDANVNEGMVAKLSEGINSQLGKAIKDTDKNDYTRLANIVQNHPNSYEIKSLAYIHFEKNTNKNTDPALNTWKDISKWVDPIKEEQLVALQINNPRLPINKLGHDLAYPAMLTYLPSGLLGLVLASLIAAFMSTISTHLNWGSSYVVNDFWQRFINPKASQKELVNVGRISTVVLMIFAAILALFLENALQAFNILLQIGAGTGLIFILRWFWWRINAYSEFTAMVVSFILAFVFSKEDFGMESHEQLVAGVIITTFSWVLVTYLTPATDRQVLINFYKKIRPSSFGWQPIVSEGIAENQISIAEVSSGKLPMQILSMLIGCFVVYGALFATGYWLYGETNSALISTAVTVVGLILLFIIWSRDYDDSL